MNRTTSRIRRTEPFIILLIVTAFMLFTAFTYTSAAKGDAKASPEAVTCAYREAAGDRNLSFDWEPNDPVPWVSFYSDTITGTRMVGGVRCQNRWVEWVWETGVLTPTMYITTDTVARRIVVTP